MIKTKLHRPINYFFENDENQKRYCIAILQEDELRGRFKQLSEIPNFLRVFFDWQLNYNPDILIHKKSDKKTAIRTLMSVYELLNIDWDIGEKEKLKEKIYEIQSKTGIDNVGFFHPLRVALSGQKDSPSWLLLLSYLGLVESLNRIESAITLLES